MSNDNEKDKPDWFRRVLGDMDGTLSYKFRHILDGDGQRHSMWFLKEYRDSGMAHEGLVAEFEEHVRKLFE